MGAKMNYEKIVENIIGFGLMFLFMLIMVVAAFGGAFMASSAHINNVVAWPRELTSWQKCLPAIWVCSGIIVAVVAFLTLLFKSDEWDRKLTNRICEILNRKFPRTFSVLV